MNIGRQSMNGVLYHYDKWLMLIKRVDPFSLLFLQGVFGFTLFLILIGLEFSFCTHPNNWYCYDVGFFSKLDTNGIWYSLIEFIRFIISNICIVQTINFYSPLHLLGTYIISMVFDWIAELIQQKIPFNIISFFGYIILLFGYLMFTEKFFIF